VQRIQSLNLPLQGKLYKVSKINNTAYNNKQATINYTKKERYTVYVDKEILEVLRCQPLPF
jgi:hypothetical protein